MPSLFKAFRRQNSALVEHLTKFEWRALKPHIEHHSGGLLVAGRYFDYPAGSSNGIYCKVHDTWGDPDDPNEGPIVVHLYDPEVSPEGDVVLHFTSGVDAVNLFLNDEALSHFWKVTR